MSVISRVRGIVDLLELRRGQMRIDLRRGQRLMAEQLLDASQVGAIIEHVSRKAMAQRMGADRRIQPGHLEVLVHLAPDASRAQSPSVLVHKQNLGVEVAVALGTLVSIFHVVLNDLQRG